MKGFIRAGIAAAACCVFPLAAQCADLGRGRTLMMAPPAVNVWTGCYVGLNLGGGWAQVTVTDLASGASLGTVAPAGVVGGGQVGCDLQTGLFVIGVQAMADAADIKGSRLQPNGAVTTRFNVPWIETLTARGGFAVQPMTLLYVKGGAAWVRDNMWTDAGGVTTGTGIITPMGWTIGAGVEYRFATNWSAFLEYGYLGFGNRQMTLVSAAGVGTEVNLNHNVQMLLVGVNFRFGGGY